MGQLNRRMAVIQVRCPAVHGTVLSVVWTALSVDLRTFLTSFHHPPKPLPHQSNDVSEDGGGVTIRADAPLAQMFGYSTDLRSITQVRTMLWFWGWVVWGFGRLIDPHVTRITQTQQGKGEFTMEYKTHQPVTRDMQEQLIKKYKEQQAAENQ